MRDRAGGGETAHASPVPLLAWMCRGAHHRPAGSPQGEQSRIHGRISLTKAIINSSKGRVLSVLGLTLVYATCYAAIKAGLAFAPPLLFAGLRAIIAGAALLALAATQRKRIVPSRGDWGWVLALGVIATTLSFGTMFLSPGRTGAGIAPADLVQGLRNGQSVVDVAAGKVSEQDLVNVLLQPQIDALNLQVKYGYLTQDQANSVQTNMANQAKFQLEQKGLFDGSNGNGYGYGYGIMGGFGGMMGGFGPGYGGGMSGMMGGFGGMMGRGFGFAN